MYLNRVMRKRFRFDRRAVGDQTIWIGHYERSDGTFEVKDSYVWYGWMDKLKDQT